MNYQLRRMKRKTVGIYITKEGEIEVRAPRSVSEAEIDRLVQEKEAWITTHQTKMRERIQLQAMGRIRPRRDGYISRPELSGRAFANKGYFLQWNALFAARSAGGRAARRPC